MQHLTEVLVDSAIVAGTTVAHRTTPSAPPEKPWPGSGAWDGSPTSRWPACMAKPHNWAVLAPDQWRELSAGRAMELGAVPCTASGCAEVGA